MSTLKDIAARLGLSVATVSRVLNRDKRFSVAEQTRENIFRTAEELGYVRAAKDEKKTTPSFGLVTWYNEREELLDPYYLTIRLGVEKTAFARNIRLNRFFRKNGRFQFDSSSLDGIIAIGKFNEEELAGFSDITTNIVCVDDAPNDRRYDSVVTDFEKAVCEVLDYLYQAGHRRIGYIGGRDFTVNNELFQQDFRELAYIHYMKRKGQYRLSDLYLGRYTPDDGYALAKAMLERKKLPTAVFIANDSLAIGVMRALYEHGVSVPEDISLAGFNDNESSRYLIPSLTTVKVHAEFMGQEAVSLLLERMESGRPIAKRVVLPTELVIRESSRSVNLASKG
ncbi:LacI family DNA-binding transcriptional regulator [Paenibacillaceae bacterium WGS1546]|uniref:LacI family DNA-binding transcriptional regulator n=1 Tax=Cohnella sp. WGS1546 TaxID=3366810 RepID=UPI00372D666F